MSVKNKLFVQETLEELRDLLSQQKTANSYQKIQVLYLWKTGQFNRVSQIADCLGVHRVTIYKWLKKYRKGGIEELLKVGKKTGRPSSLTQEEITILTENINDPEKHFKSYVSLQKWLEEEYQIKIKYKSLYHNIRYKLGQ